MPIYENNEDRKRQSEAVKIIRKRMPSRKVVETPEIFRINHDFVILNHLNLKVGIGEIKCRNYPAEFFKTNPWLFEIERIRSLYHAGEKVGFKVMLVLYTKDNLVYWVALKTLLENWGSLENAPDYMMKNDHGDQPADKSGILIPFELLNLIEDE